MQHRISILLFLTLKRFWKKLSRNQKSSNKNALRTGNFEKILAFLVQSTRICNMINQSPKGAIKFGPNATTSTTTSSTSCLYSEPRVTGDLWGAQEGRRGGEMYLKIALCSYGSIESRNEWWNSLWWRTYFLINPSPSGPLPLGFQPQPFGETRAPRKDEQKRFAPDSQGVVDWVGVGVGDWPGWTFLSQGFFFGGFFIWPVTGPVVAKDFRSKVGWIFPYQRIHEKNGGSSSSWCGFRIMTWEMVCLYMNVYRDIHLIWCIYMYI